VTDRSQLPTTTQRRIRMAARSGILVASLLIAPSESRAQFAESARIAVGTRMWVRTHDGTEGVWRFERASADSLTLSRRSHEADELLSTSDRFCELLQQLVHPSPPRRCQRGDGPFEVDAVVILGHLGSEAIIPHAQCANAAPVSESCCGAGWRWSRGS